MPDPDLYSRFHFQEAVNMPITATRRLLDVSRAVVDGHQNIQQGVASLFDEGTSLEVIKEELQVSATCNSTNAKALSDFVTEGKTKSLKLDL